jgi:hypothetical protein
MAMTPISTDPPARKLQYRNIPILSTAGKLRQPFDGLLFAGKSRTVYSGRAIPRDCRFILPAWLVKSNDCFLEGIPTCRMSGVGPTPAAGHCERIAAKRPFAIPHVIEQARLAGTRKKRPTRNSSAGTRERAWDLTHVARVGRSIVRHHLIANRGVPSFVFPKVTVETPCISGVF